MALSTALNRRKDLLATVGQAGLNSLYPDDFEVYIIAFELVDSSDNTLEFFSFPIMPTNITITEPEITNIKKVNRGVTSLKTDSFIPRDISLSGNFGRNLKILIRDKIVDFRSFRGGIGLLKGEFQGPTIKTGYGTTKVFQSILAGSRVLDRQDKPVRLYFYNFAFGDNYVVEVVDKTFTQSRDASNLIWNYNVTLKAVAPIDNSVRDRKSLNSILKANMMQKGINNLASNITMSLPSITSRLIGR